MGDTEKVTVEVPAEAASESKTDEVKATENDYVEAGFSSQEIEMAKEQGMIPDEGNENESEGEGGVHKTDAQDISKENEGEKKEDEQKDEMKHKDGTSFNENEQGLYWEMKKDRRKRQEAENVNKRMQLENKYLTENLQSIKEQQESIEAELAGLKDKNDEDFLTPEDRERKAELRNKEKEIQKQKNDLKLKDDEDDANAKKAKRAGEQLAESEKDFRQTHPSIDFDQCANFADEIITSVKEGTVEEFFADEVKAAYAEKIAKKFVDSSMRLSMGDPLDEELPELVYRMAKIHPQYNNGSKKTPELKGRDITSGKITPDKTGNIDRMMKNADRKNTAAMGGSGGGRILVSEDDLTWEDARKLSKGEFDKLSQPTINRLLKD